MFGEVIMKERPAWSAHWNTLLSKTSFSKCYKKRPNLSPRFRRRIAGCLKCVKRYNSILCGSEGSFTFRLFSLQRNSTWYQLSMTTVEPYCQVWLRSEDKKTIPCSELITGRHASDKPFYRHGSPSPLCCQNEFNICFW
jgi:hypothetical protein